ncbi:MAG: hypothetical protein IJY88_03970 [Clostridia bacterium]|nr:hypothetical protein [Clostridia bacterium]
MAEKKKTKPISNIAATVLVVAAFAVMAVFLVYMFSSGGSGSEESDVSIEQSFADETSLAPEQSIAEIKETMADANVGDAVLYGSYEQNGNSADGKENIEWIVLEKQQGKLLLVSRYVIEAMPYNTERSESEWAQSSLYGWLNGEFINNSFTAEESGFIIADENGSKVSMLSAENAKKYYEYDSWRACAPTEYAKEKGLKLDNGYCCYWLTDKGEIDNSASYIYFNGTLRTHGFAVDYTQAGVRPIIWVNSQAETETEDISEISE